jgi:hypothetical protein
MKQHVSKHRQPIRRTIVYSIMTASVVFLVTIMMLLVLGYSFNRDDGRIEQGGLLQFGTTPSGAKVLLNGDDTDSRTTAKSTVPSGTHTVRYELDRYRPWEKTILI